MAHYIVEYTDNGDRETRDRLRSQHIEFRRGFAERMLLAGPLLDASGESVGSLILIEADDIEKAKAAAAADPLVEAGVLALVAVRPFRVASIMGKASGG